MNNNEIIIYQNQQGEPRIEARFEGETIWLTQEQMAALFQTTKQNSSLHINNVFKEGELNANSVVKEYLTTAADGKNYKTKHYNLDMIISLGYRINSKVATNFRIWATNRLREYIQKGFTMDDERLKELGGGVYWRELLDRIRDIRSSEKVFWRQVLELYATSIDYDAKTAQAQQFFQTIQNKMHFAAHGHTAAETILLRANAESPFMGMTTFKGKRPVKSETTIAKNYLTEDELAILNRLVSSFLDFAEVQAMRHIPMKMTDWIDYLDDFLKAGRSELLLSAGKVSEKAAHEKAETEYAKYKSKTVDELSPVEKDLLNNIKNAQKAIAQKAKIKEDRQ